MPLDIKMVAFFAAFNTSNFISFIITMMSWWTRWRLKSPASQLFTQPFIQAQIKENMKALHQWPLWGELTGDRKFLAQRASNAETVSSWWHRHVTVGYVESRFLTLKRLGHFFQNVILFSNLAHQKCNIFVWNWFNTMNVWSALWILMAWCFSTRASVTTVLTTHPCVSRCLRVKQCFHHCSYGMMSLQQPLRHTMIIKLQYNNLIISIRIKYWGHRPMPIHT